MALASKKSNPIHDKDGSDKVKLKDEFDAGHIGKIATAPDEEPAIAGVIYQIGLVQEDVDELRRHVVSDVVGSRGPKGDDGDAGSDGSNGNNGSTGSRGPTGNTGARGAAGADGADGGVYGNTIKILPTQFMGNDDASLERTVIEDDIRNKIGVRVVSSAQEIFASVAIPEGKKVTGYAVYSSSTVVTFLNGVIATTGALSVIGNGNSGAVINLRTAYNSAATNYVAIKVITTTTSQVIYGAIINIADI